MTVGVQGPLWSPGPVPSPHTMRESHSGEEEHDYARGSAKQHDYHHEHSNRHLQYQQQHDNAQHRFDEQEDYGGRLDNNNGNRNHRDNKNNNNQGSAIGTDGMAVTPATSEGIKITNNSSNTTSTNNHIINRHDREHSNSVTYRHSFSNGSPPSASAGEQQVQPLSARDARQSASQVSTSTGSRLHRSSTEPSVGEQESSGYSFRVTPYERLSSDLANDPRVMKEITLGRRIAFYRIRGEIGTGNFSQVKMGIHVLTKGRPPPLLFFFSLLV